MASITRPTLRLASTVAGTVTLGSALGIAFALFVILAAVLVGGLFGLRDHVCLPASGQPACAVAIGPLVLGSGSTIRGIGIGLLLVTLVLYTIPVSPILRARVRRRERQWHKYHHKAKSR